MSKNILFLTGSMNQTTQMHKIASNLTEYNCYFSQYFSDNIAIQWAIKLGLLDNTVLGNPLRKKAESYLNQNQLPIDYQAKDRQYDLVVFCSDLLFPNKFKGIKTIWVQEGMIDPMTWLSQVVRKLKLPRYWSMGTALNGTSNLCDIYCAASEGYKNYLITNGTAEAKVLVTGIPNYDNIQESLRNDFPFSDYVMIATSDIRETFRNEDRVAFLNKCVEIAAGRRMLFKLHPNENFERASKEIKSICPSDTLIYTEGNTNEMIANCVELITQYSTVVYTGIALNKPVHSYFDLAELRQLLPIQNGGSSAEQIASVCRSYLLHEGDLSDFLPQLSNSLTCYAD